MSVNCDHRIVEEGDGHGHNYLECVKCGQTWWIAPWILNPPYDD